MINKESFFNDNTINVFTDASVKNYGQVTESISGIVIEPGYESRYTRLIPSTNNEGEIYAIYMGILACIEIKNRYPDRDLTFNLFSDSRICVFGVREWYRKWINNAKRIKANALISSSGEEVKNQQIFIKCFNEILCGNIHINIYHVRGHIDMRKQWQIKEFSKDFKESNHLLEYPSDELIAELVKMNDMVDNSSRALLLPQGRYMSIPTIMGTHKKSDMTSFYGVPIKSEYLFTHDMRRIVNEKRRYMNLTNHKTNFKED